MYHLSCLSADKDYNNENIYFYISECNENMTKSYHTSFPTFWLYYEMKPIWLIGSQIVEFSYFCTIYLDGKTLVKFNESMDANYLEGPEENGYSTFLGGWSTFYTFLGG